MTIADLTDSKKALEIPKIGTVIAEPQFGTPEDIANDVEIRWRTGGQIFSNLQSGANVAASKILQSNKLLAGRGVCLHGAGFLLAKEEVDLWGKNYLDSVVKPYCKE